MRLNHTALRILLLLQSSHGCSPSLRWLAERLGIRSMNGVHCHLRRLRGLGLVTWEPKRFRTLRATCRFIPEGEL